MPLEGLINDRVPATGTRKSRRIHQLIDQSSTRTLAGEPRRQEHSLTLKNISSREFHCESRLVAVQVFNLTFNPLDLVFLDRMVEGPAHIGRDRTFVACISDHRPALVHIALAQEPLHVPRAEPAGIAIELVFSYPMSRYDLNVMAFIH